MSKFACDYPGCTEPYPHGHLAHRKMYWELDKEERVREIINKIGEVKGKKDFDGTVDGAGYKRSMDDPNKPQLTQVPPVFIAGVARVLMHGAKKYARGNWLRGMSFSEVLDAMKRHIAAIEMGEDLDPDSGLPHIDHVACGAAFYSWYTNGPTKEKYAQFDDRMYKPKSNG